MKLKFLLVCVLILSFASEAFAGIVVWDAGGTASLADSLPLEAATIWWQIGADRMVANLPELAFLVDLWEVFVQSVG